MIIRAYNLNQAALKGAKACKHGEQEFLLYEIKPPCYVLGGLVKLPGKYWVEINGQRANNNWIDTYYK